MSKKRYYFKKELDRYDKGWIMLKYGNYEPINSYNEM